MKCFFLGLLLLSFNCFSQKLGSKKIITVQLKSYGCGDFCYITFVNINQPKIEYSFDNIDAKTKDHGNLQAIQDEYYKSEENDNAILKKGLYSIKLEYRLIDEYVNTGIEEQPKKTGRKLKRWMINNLTKINLKNTDKLDSIKRK